jgi:hypothetical protein
MRMFTHPNGPRGKIPRAVSSRFNMAHTGRPFLNAPCQGHALDNRLVGLIRWLERGQRSTNFNAPAPDQGYCCAKAETGAPNFRSGSANYLQIGSQPPDRIPTGFPAQLRPVGSIFWTARKIRPVAVLLMTGQAGASVIRASTHRQAEAQFDLTV